MDSMMIFLLGIGVGYTCACGIVFLSQQITRDIGRALEKHFEELRKNTTAQGE